MFRFTAFILFFVFALICSAATPFDCLWGGQNEETSYTIPFVNGLNGKGLSPNNSNMNLGAPPAAGIPVQATPQTQAGVVPQTTIPTINAQMITNGGIGTVGQPATIQTGISAIPDTQIIYVRPVQIPTEQECQNGVQRTAAVETEIVPANTLGAIPVAVKTMTVAVPKVERRWSYSPIKQKTEKLVEVVDPRTGRVVKTYCDEEEHRSILPWFHMKENITYENIEAKVAVPVKL